MVKVERDIRAMAVRCGLKVIDLRKNNSGHYALIAQAPNTRERTFHFAGTSSDRRASKNNEADMKRFVRDNQNPTAMAVSLTKAFRPAIEKPQEAAEPPIPPPPPIAMTEPKAKPVTRNVLTQVDFYRLCDWMKTADLAGIHTMPKLSLMAHTATGISVTPANTKSALEAVGRMLPTDPARRPKPATPNERILARAIVGLMQSLGQEPGEDLQSLAE